MAVGKKLNRSLRKFIERQPIFFVATAGPTGRVNLSPKGLDTLRILDDNRIFWLSLSGSGNETAAHLRENPRMTLMFCAFEGDALMLRTYGTASVLHPRDEGWDETAAMFPELAGSRQIYDLKIDLVQTSCGTGVPEMKLVRSRGEHELEPWFADLGEDGVKDFWQRKNVTSIVKTHGHF